MCAFVKAMDGDGVDESAVRRAMKMKDFVRAVRLGVFAMMLAVSVSAAMAQVEQGRFVGRIVDPAGDRE